MGMISALKAGYKSIFLWSLLKIFDIPGGYWEAARNRALQQVGMKGIDFRGKPHILDCMIMLKTVRENSATKECIQNCWRKADILPTVSWDVDINNEVGSATMAMQDKTKLKEACHALCNLMSSIKLKANEVALDTSTEDGSVFRNSSVTGRTMQKEELYEMVETWIDVEDKNKDIIDSIVDDELDRLDKAEEMLVSSRDEEEYEKGVVERRSLKRKINHLDALRLYLLYRITLKQTAWMGTERNH